MNCLIAKAAKSRAKYVNEKYYLGLDCNNCKSYLSLLNCYFAKKCTSSNCNCKCCEEENVSYTIVSNCPPIEVNVNSVDCSDISISSPNNYISCTMSTLEATSYVTFIVNTLESKLEFKISSFIVDSVEYLPVTQTFEITPINIQTTTIDTVTVVSNFAIFLNSLNIPNFTFANAVGKNTVGTKKAGLRITYPQGKSWKIETLAVPAKTGYDATDGYIITQDGLQNYTANNLTFVVPSMIGSYNNFLNTVNDCQASTQGI